MDILDTILKWAGKSGKSENPGQRLFPADKRPTLDNLAETVPARKAAAQEALSPVFNAISMLAPMNTVSQLATYSPESEGAIRKGGRTDLNLTHEGAIQKFLDLLTGRGSMHSPSVAISSNNAFPFKDISNTRSASLILNPASHYFDPRLNPANLLINRDAYVTRQKWTPKEVRLGLTDDLRLTEGARGATLREIYGDINVNNLPGAQQQASILASPRFKSFTAYEKSQQGAATLDPEMSYDAKTVRDLLEKYYNDDYSAAIRSSSPVDTEYLLRKIESDATKAMNVKGPDDKAASALILNNALGRVFSDYAELKVAGEVPLNDKTVSAFMLSPYLSPINTPEHLQSLIAKTTKKAESKGIRVGTPEELMPADLQMTYMDMAEQMARMMLKDRQATGSAYDAIKVLPESTRKYIPQGIMPVAIEDALRSNSLTATYENTLDAVKRSSAYAGDVASILTARDLDAVSTPNILKLLQEKIK